MSSDLKTINSILVVGGGSSGWMAATYLSTILTGVEVTVVESPTLPTIGVGEATIPFIRDYMERIGFVNDRVWMRQCDATFKTGILFENWYERGDVYWHPFEYLDYLDTHTHTGHCWLYLHNRGHPVFRDRRSFYYSFFRSTTLNALHCKAPSLDEYAYHFDAHLFGEFLRRAASSVRQIRDNVVFVRLNEDGEIDSLITENNGELKADLYIDCTGFRSLLIKQVDRHQSWISYANSLFCDRGVVIRLPYVDEDDRKRQMHPYVKATALSAGWVWTIPLYSKFSTGYVYSSSFTTDDDAETELRRHWGEQRTEGFNSLRLKFRTGKFERSWVKNCVAIGLSGGFIEPLESTGLAITQVGVELLASMLDARFYHDQMIERYNAHLDKFYADIVHFIIPHYCFTNREDTKFWQTVKHETEIPSELAARLSVFRRYLPTTGTKGTSEVWMFRDISWFSVLLGMNFDFEPPVVREPVLSRLKDVLATKRKTVENMLNSLPNHYEYLRDRIFNT